MKNNFYITYIFRFISPMNAPPVIFKALKSRFKALLFSYISSLIQEFNVPILL